MCDKCGRDYKDIFDTIVRMDYAEPGKGKVYTWHLCTKCRKELIEYFKWN